MLAEGKGQQFFDRHLLQLALPVEQDLNIRAKFGDKLAADTARADFTLG